MSEKVVAIRPQTNDHALEFTDGRFIQCYHEASCCEYNYADWSSLDDTGFYEEDFRHKPLKIETWSGGFRINGYSVNCYSEQNGYYSDALEIHVNDFNGATQYNTVCGDPYYD